jgi:hypothetical protein
MISCWPRILGDADADTTYEYIQAEYISGYKAVTRIFTVLSTGLNHAKSWKNNKHFVYAVPWLNTTQEQRVKLPKAIDYESSLHIESKLHRCFISPSFSPLLQLCFEIDCTYVGLKQRGHNVRVSIAVTHTVKGDVRV